MIYAKQVVAVGWICVILSGSLWYVAALDGQVNPVGAFVFYSGGACVVMGGFGMLVAWLRRAVLHRHHQGDDAKGDCGT